MQGTFTLITNGEIRKLSHYGTSVTFDATDLARHLFSQFVQKKIQLLGCAFGNQLDSSIGQVANTAYHLMATGNRTSCIPETNTLDMPRIGYLPTLGHLRYLPFLNLVAPTPFAYAIASRSVLDAHPRGHFWQLTASDWQYTLWAILGLANGEAARSSIVAEKQVGLI